MSRKKRLLYRCAAVLAAVTVTALVAELAMRLAGYAPRYYNPLGSFHRTDDAIGHMGKRDFSGRYRRPEFDVLVKHDSHGFRVQEVRNDPATCERTLHVLGDSFVWGWGVDQGEVFTDDLSRRMATTHVRNYGLNKSGTLQQRLLFHRHVEATLRPGDIVLLLHCLNDFRDNVDGFLTGVVRDGGVAGTRLRLLGGGLKGFLKDHSYLFNFLNFSLARVRDKWKRRHGVRLADLGGGPYADGDDEMVIMRTCLRGFRSDCAGKGARFLVVAIPGTGFTDDALRRACRATRVELFELRPVFEALGSDWRDRFLIRNDEHWNAEGHRIAGLAIAEHLSGGFK